MAIQLDLLTKVTDGALLDLSRHNPGYRFERTAEGRVIVSPTGGDSGRRSGEVFAQLHLWNGHAGLGIAFDSSTGFNLPDGSCRSPDASWVARERWESLGRSERRGFPPLCPDAAFEVRSESDGLADLRAKMRDYLRHGARLAVLVDPEARAVEVYRPGQAPERHQGDAAITLEPELPGFSLDPRPVFQD